jgi:subtilisin family serine protease
MAADTMPSLQAIPEHLLEKIEREGLIVKLRDAQQGLPSELSQQTQAQRELIPGMWLVTTHSSEQVDAIMSEWGDDDRIEYFELDQRIGSTAALPDDDHFAKQWALHNTGQSNGVKDADIDAPAAWKLSTGTGQTVVAVIDTGIDWKHPDLKNRIWTNADEIAGNGIDDDGNGYVDDVRGWDFVNWDNNPMDDHGHGTHVAGIIGANGDNGRGVAGVNWSVKLMPLKFLDSDGAGYLSDAITAIEYAIENGATISNNSWGGSGYSQSLYDTLAYARQHDHIFVVAAGNDSDSLDQHPDYPASYGQWLDNVVVVGSTTRQDHLSGFSNYGKTVDIAAPGSSILSTYLRNEGKNDAKGYKTFSGTSMATPFVAGAASLIRDLHPEWSYKQVIDHVLGTADEIKGLSKQVDGGRRLNLGRAVREASEVPRGGKSSAQMAIENSGPKNETPPPAPIHSSANQLVHTMMIEEMADGDACVVEAVASADTNVAIPHLATYDISVTGRADGSKFSKSGTLSLVPTIMQESDNRRNARDVFFKIGDPLNTPRAGELALATNYEFFSTGKPQYDNVGKLIPGLADLDVANVWVKAKKRTITIEYGVPTRYDVSSGIFSTQSDPTAPLFAVTSGTVTLKLSKDFRSITGSIDLRGFGSDGSSIAIYKAKISGTRR